VLADDAGLDAFKRAIADATQRHAP
jgi:hypothetical protein